VASKEIGLEVIADKIKLTVMSRDQNAGLIHSIKIDNKPFEIIEQFQHWEQHYRIEIPCRKK
jgi:hypothetical protein